MIDKKQIELLANEATKEVGVYVVELKIGNDNNISITIDGDEGVNINQCVSVSKFIEGNLDREALDFELNVSSYGIDHPIIMLRQYQKYINKTIELHLMDDTIKRGILESADSSTIVLKEEIVKKNRKSKKMLFGETIEVPTASIKLAKGLIVF